MAWPCFWLLCLPPWYSDQLPWLLLSIVHGAVSAVLCSPRWQVVSPETVSQNECVFPEVAAAIFVIKEKVSNTLALTSLGNLICDLVEYTRMHVFPFLLFLFKLRQDLAWNSFNSQSSFLPPIILKAWAITRPPPQAWGSLHVRHTIHCTLYLARPVFARDVGCTALHIS